MPVMDFPSSPINGQTTTDGRYYFDSSVGSSGAWRSTPLPVGGLPAGSIMAWGTNTPPANWLLADGSAVSRSVYSSLFAVIGTQYGAGDGTTTFNLPDLRGRVPVGRNGGTFGTLGATGGAETHTLSVNEMPSHNHGGNTGSSTAYNDTSIYNDGGSTNFVADSWAGSYVGSDPTFQNRFIHSHTISSQGGGQAHNNLQPYQVVNYIIKFSAGWTAGDSELATRLGVVETANATTNRSGLVPVVPTSVAVGSGTGTANSLGQVTFSGSTSVSLNGVFGATYQNYRIIFSQESGTATGSDLTFRFRSSGADMSTTNYFYNGTSVEGGTVTGYNAVGYTYMYFGYLHAFTGDTHASVIAEIQRPSRARAKTYTAQAFGWTGSTNRLMNTGGFVNLNALYDGFTVYTANGTTFGGTIQVYGYR